MIKRAVIIFVGLCLLAGAVFITLKIVNNSTVDDQQPMPITIRVENRTDRDLIRAALGHDGNPGAIVAPQQLGDLGPGEISQPVKTPLNQADYRRVAAVVDGRVYSFLSFDFSQYFGSDSDLPAGDYIFAVESIDDEDRWLEVKIINTDDI